MDPIRALHSDSVTEEKTQSGDDTGKETWNTHTHTHTGLTDYTMKVLHTKETDNRPSL